jgi:hypothetical protein
MSQVPPMESQMGGGLQPHRGTMILVFGILGLVCCVLFGIAAWVMGNKDLEAMNAGMMDRSGEGLTKAGKICGIIAVAVAVLGIVLNLVWLLVFGGLLIGGAGGP